MFRSLLLKRPGLVKPTSNLRIALTYNPLKFQRHSFHSSGFQLAKKKTKTSKKGKEEPVEEDDAEAANIDFEDATVKFQSVIEKFNKAASEAKLGKTNPKIFDKLSVNTHDGELPFTSVAQTSVKGRNFIITLFDPENSKHVINTILGSGLNMNAQVDPSNKFTLKVPLPPVTTETKNESVKHLKEIFEKFKHGSAKNNSLSSIRSEVRNKFTKQLKGHKSTDAENKLLTQFEKLHKQYSDKLNESFKTAESSIVK